MVEPGGQKRDSRKEGRAEKSDGSLPRKGAKDRKNGSSVFAPLAPFRGHLPDRSGHTARAGSSQSQSVAAIISDPVKLFRAPGKPGEGQNR